MSLDGTSLDELVPAPYAFWANKAMAHITGQELFITESDVAETVWGAVHDTTGHQHFPAGPDAIQLAQAQ
ncbi:hypothetical protein ABZ876_35705 [Streptomyces sp. NPDC046931]|uniref:hypothetical protein n=1 Tax=Streptomyces sp. NPDC046931 TaxID=3154806 RepID=UPI0033CA7845